MKESFLYLLTETASAWAQDTLMTIPFLSYTNTPKQNPVYDPLFIASEPSTIRAPGPLESRWISNAKKKHVLTQNQPVPID